MSAKIVMHLGSPLQRADAAAPAKCLADGCASEAVPYDGWSLYYLGCGGHAEEPLREALITGVTDPPALHVPRLTISPGLTATYNPESGAIRISLPDDSAARKNIPLARGLLDYFPAALAAVAVFDPVTACAAPCCGRFQAIPPEQPEHDHVATFSVSRFFAAGA